MVKEFYQICKSCAVTFCARSCTCSSCWLLSPWKCLTCKSIDSELIVRETYAEPRNLIIPHVMNLFLQLPPHPPAWGNTPHNFWVHHISNSISDQTMLFTIAIRRPGWIFCLLVLSTAVWNHFLKQISIWLVLVGLHYFIFRFILMCCFALVQMIHFGLFWLKKSLKDICLFLVCLGKGTDYHCSW